MVHLKFTGQKMEAEHKSYLAEKIILHSALLLVSLFTKRAAFKILKNRPELFAGAEIYPGGYGIIQNDQPDLPCDELYEKRSADAGI